MRFIRIGLAAALAATLLASPMAAFAADDDDPAFVRLSVGRYDVNDDMGAIEFRAEYQSSKLLWIVKPFAGLMATTDKAVYVYGGFLYDLYLGDRFVLTPSLAAGLYADGDGKDLGHVVEFRSSIELAYRFDDRSRLGVSVYHISNASLSDNNPGTEIVSLNYAIPLN